MISEIFQWWCHQMAALMRPLTSRFTGLVQDALLVTIDPAVPSVARIIHRRDARLISGETLRCDDPLEAWRDALGTRRRNEPVILSLTVPFLSRRVALPRIADRDLPRVLGYEMDRLTPFDVADVHFAPAAVQRSQGRNVMSVELVVVPRVWLAAVTRCLHQVGVHPAVLEAPGPDGVSRRIPLETIPTGAGWTSLIRRSGAVVCALLAASCVLTPLIRQSMALADIEARIEILRPRLKEADELRRRIAAKSSGSGQIATARRTAGMTPLILARISALLPDDTWLTALHLTDRKVIMEGVSSTATKLIGTLASEPKLKNPAFSAPVVRDASGKDSFSIQAELAL